MIANDNILEENENFMLTIDSSSSSTGVTIGNPNQAALTIMNDDGKYVSGLF